MLLWCFSKNGIFKNQFSASSYPQLLEIPGNPFRQFHRFSIQLIKLGVYCAHGFLEVEVLIHLFRRHAHIAARGETPVVLFDFLDADQLDKSLHIEQF